MSTIDMVPKSLSTNKNANEVDFLEFQHNKTHEREDTASLSDYRFRGCKILARAETANICRLCSIFCWVRGPNSSLPHTQLFTVSAPYSFLPKL